MPTTRKLDAALRKLTFQEDMPGLQSPEGQGVALERVKVEARLQDLRAEVEIEQHYKNPGRENIEVVYTFPLPMGAVLLGFEVKISNRLLVGTVVEKQEAEGRYEDAITEGKTAIMLEQTAPGLYTANLGNLSGFRRAVIRYRYTLLLSWQGDFLRFLLPTTIAPRYGDPQGAGLQPHQVPVSSLMVDYPLDLTVTVLGELSKSEISSPSHAISLAHTDRGRVVRPMHKTALDRDFVLALKSGNVAQSTGSTTNDGNAHVSWASFRIPRESGMEVLRL